MRRLLILTLAACAMLACAAIQSSAKSLSIKNLSIASFFSTRATSQRMAQSAPTFDVQSLIEQLRSQKPQERASAACALGRMEAGGAAAIPSLASLLSDGAEVSKTCGYESPFEDEEWQPDYKTVKEATVGEAATQALIAIGPASLDALIDNLTANASWRARKNAAWALAHRGNARAMQQMLIALRDDNAWQVRAEAAYALFQRGGAKEETVNALIAATRDEAWQVRQQAASALGHKGSSKVDVTGPLMSLLREDKDARVRGEAAWSLRHTANGRLFPALLEALKDEDAGVRGRVAETLGHRAGNEEVPLLIAALKDKDTRVRAGAKQALKIVKVRSQGTQTYLKPLPPGIPE